MDSKRRRVRTVTAGSINPPPAPDGGWGYMVILGISISFFNIGGVGLSNTLIYQQLREKFGKSAVETAWVNSIQGTFRFVSSPLASASCNRYGVRATVIVGAVLSAGGVIATAFPPNLYYVYFFYGVMTGFGTSLVVTSCFIIVGQYFDKKRGKANAVATMGSAMGGIVIAPCVTLMFDQYGFSGTLLLLGALYFHFFISAALFRPVEANTSPKSSAGNIEPSPGNQAKQENNGGSHDYAKPCLLNEETRTKDMLIVPPDVGRLGSSLELTEPMQFGSSVSFSNDANVTSEATNFTKKKKSFCTKHFSVDLLRGKDFVSFSFLMLCVFLSFALNATFLASIAKERRITHSYLAIIFIINSSLDFAGRLLSGLTFDLGNIRRWRLLIFCLLGVLYAVSLALLPLTYDFVTFVIATVPRVIAGAAFHSQHLTILGDIVGAKRLPSAIGLCRFFMGIGQIIGPTIGGLLRDHTGKYGPAYIFGGCVLGVGVLVFAAVNFQQVFQPQLKEKDEIQI